MLHGKSPRTIYNLRSFLLFAAGKGLQNRCLATAFPSIHFISVFRSHITASSLRLVFPNSLQIYCCSSTAQTLNTYRKEIMRLVLVVYFPTCLLFFKLIRSRGIYRCQVLVPLMTSLRSETVSSYALLPLSARRLFL